MPLHDKRKCQYCGEKYWPDRVTDKFCNRKCKKEFKEENKAYKHLSTADIGEFTELKVVLDLIDKGYDVFKSINRSNPTDIIISDKNNKLKRVEVKAGRIYKPTGNIQHGTCNKNIYDILAIYELNNNKIVYKPDVKPCIDSE